MCCIPLLSVLTAHAALSDMQKGQAPPPGITNSHFRVTAIGLRPPSGESSCIHFTSISHTPWAHSHGAKYLGVGHHCIMTKYGNIFWPIAVWLCELLESVTSLVVATGVVCKLKSNSQIPASRMMKCCAIPVHSLFAAVHVSSMSP